MAGVRPEPAEPNCACGRVLVQKDEDRSSRSLDRRCSKPELILMDARPWRRGLQLGLTAESTFAVIGPMSVPSWLSSPTLSAIVSRNRRCLSSDKA